MENKNIYVEKMNEFIEVRKELLEIAFKEDITKEQWDALVASNSNMFRKVLHKLNYNWAESKTKEEIGELERALENGNRNDVVSEACDYLSCLIQSIADNVINIFGSMEGVRNSEDGTNTWNKDIVSVMQSIRVLFRNNNIVQDVYKRVLVSNNIHIMCDSIISGDISFIDGLKICPVKVFDKFIDVRTLEIIVNNWLELRPEYDRSNYAKCLKELKIMLYCSLIEDLNANSKSVLGGVI